MKVSLLAITPNSEEIIEKATRTCYNSEPNPKTRASFLKSVISRGHTSVIEHASATFYIEEVSRALTHQLVRHRIASYSQKSQRYVKENNFEYIVPKTIKIGSPSYFKFIDAMSYLQLTYSLLLKEGVPAEDARFLLPNACKTTITVTMNFRALRNFFLLRLDNHSQWEIRELAQKMLQLVSKEAPNIFSDFNK